MSSIAEDFKALCDMFDSEFIGVHRDTYNNAPTTKILGTHVQFGHNRELLPMAYTIGSRTVPSWILLYVTKEFKKKADELGITYSNCDSHGCMYL